MAGRVLQVTVHDQHGVARSFQQSAGQGGFFAEIAGETERADAGICAGGFGQSLPAAVTRAVVYEEELVIQPGGDVTGDFPYGFGDL